jgi:hypothetical protein
MPNGNLLKFGILRCRDLVELYYGARMVVQVLETAIVPIANTQAKLLGQDPRRIKYEIIVSNPDAAAHFFEVGSPSAMDAGNNAQYELAPNTSLTIERDFFADLEGVTLALAFLTDSAAVTIGTREVILTPAPVDEVPLG